MTSPVSQKHIRDSFSIEQTQPGLINIQIYNDMPDQSSSAEQADLLAKQTLRFFEQEPQKEFNILLEILHAGRGNVSSEARKIYTAMAKHPQLNKVAVVGKSIYLKVIVGFVIRASKNENSMQWFTERSKALEWLSI